MNPEVKTPSLGLALLPFAALITMLAFVIVLFKDSALNGASQIVLLIATALCSSIAVFGCRVRWETIERQIANNIFSIAPSILILLLIGMLAGSWMISGIVPTLIYYGLQVMQTDLFLAACCALCAVVSVMTGSSWTTIATIGIALIGIGQAQGFSAPWVAGAIISGAYFGDKMSPLSDTTVLAASVTGTPLFSHIRYMLYTTVPSMTIALVVFAIAGFSRERVDSTQIMAFPDALRGSFNLSPWLLIVPLFSGFLIAKRVSSTIVLFLSSLLAGLFALFFQPDILLAVAGDDVSGIMAYLKGLIITFYDHTQIETGYEPLNELVATRGMSGMMNTIWLIICAMCFGGAMSASGMLGRISDVFLKFMKGRASMVTSTVVSGLMLNACTADQFIAIILNSEMFKKAYEEKGYESRLLSRTTEDSVTVTSVLIPWTTCGMTQSTILGISTWAYLPYCVFNIACPCMSILLSIIGYKIYKRETATSSAN